MLKHILLLAAATLLAGCEDSLVTAGAAPVADSPIAGAVPPEPVIPGGVVEGGAIGPAF